MFEQSILAEQPTNKRWTMAVSLSLEALLVFIAGLIPLIYTQQIPAFAKLVQGMPAPLPARRPDPPVVPKHAAAAPSRNSITFIAPARIPDRVPVVHDQPDAVTLEPMGPVVPGALGDPTGPSGIGRLLSDIHVTNPIQRPPGAEPATQPKPHARIRVSVGVQEAKLIHKVIPAYPPLAIAARVSGTVRLLGVIAKDGTIQNLQVISGHPLLVNAALDAVRQWVYRPTLLSGEPVEVIAPINVNFTLAR